MKKYLNHPIIPLKNEKYLALIVILAPLLYFLSGINLDMYAPSLPTIATYFQSSIVSAKNTMSAALLGWGVGAYFFGFLVDSYGRKRILLFGMFCYAIASMLAIFSHNIHQLIFLRFLQNFFIASILGARVLVTDLFSGRAYTIAMLYTTIGYGLGPIVGPFVGGFLQYYFNWQANFIGLFIIGLMLFFLLLVFLKEPVFQRHPFNMRNILHRSWRVLSHKQFMVGVLLGGITQVQLMIYPTVGPFIVEQVFHGSVLLYGNSALMVGAAYLVGSLFNRILLRYVTPVRICDIGFVVLFFALLIVLVFSLEDKMDLTTVMLPIFIMGISIGFIYPNVLGANLKQFSHMTGAAMAIQSSALLSFAALGVFFLSHFHIVSLWDLTGVIAVIAILESVLFFCLYRKIF